ncbi:hypothetical protein NC652_027149 [Populus alba x Populus x berolinensis]|uniref:Uncharacterized protein n=1 Tax=Populus alba x Populus x berolinensis TaxID=444605 RepID=A0AAD6M407_9ROSI|nr:hypothetical protein NC652_027149 [Populus alba x Populus x berolinensis]KAJ6978477.1 hypothetical protein NC653_026783 [Populus alba x Populus x berolinensis]KAJ6978529.1 hypothetical protein NC653_026831 [Populus alba x Populus x berolinensis]KAJ6978534.1 hypothetical protein NC653_026836 [Populus alba x Populus x berolinensis]
MDQGVSSKRDFISNYFCCRIFLGGDGEKCQLQGLEVLPQRDSCREHHETAEANKRTLEIEVDKDDRLDIELPEEKKFNEEKIVDKVLLKHKEVTLKRNQIVTTRIPDP